AVLAVAELEAALADAEVGGVVVGVRQLGRPAGGARGVEALDPDLVDRAVPQQGREVPIRLGGQAAALEARAQVEHAGELVGRVEANDARVRRRRRAARVADQRAAA